MRSYFGKFIRRRRDWKRGSSRRVSVLPGGGDAATDLVGPVGDDVELACRRLFVTGLNHQEALTIRCNIVVSIPTWIVIPSLEKDVRLTRTEGRLSRDVHGHHPVAVTVEEFPPVARPERMRAALG